MHIVANDPSLAFYRIQEHVRKGKIQISLHEIHGK